MFKDYIGREVLIGEKEGEIIDLCGNWFKVQFFDLNEDEVLIFNNDIMEYLVG